MMIYMDSGYKKPTPIHDRSAIEMSKCLEVDVPE